MPSFADSTGDAIPFYHDGVYHIFSLTSPKGTTVYPDRLRTSWSHTVTKDLVHYTELPTALLPGDGLEPDASGVWTGSVVYGEGKFHIFYTGYCLNAEYQQTICHATSADGVEWVKDERNPVITPKTDEYEPLDWRDPYVFYNEEDQRYWILISARKNGGPTARRGCVVLYRSADLERWDYYGPLYTPYHTNCPECAELYKMGKYWVLSYSRFSEWVNTIYRISESPFGPFRTPELDGIGGRRFYAAKSMANDEGRRFYFGWAHDRANRSDTGEWYWGGAFCLPHEVKMTEEGNLKVSLPPEVLEQYGAPATLHCGERLGEIRRYGAQTAELNAPGTLSYGFFENCPKRFLFSCKIRPEKVYDSFGFILKSNEDISKCLLLQFEKGMQRVSLVNMPMDVDPFWQQSCQAIHAPKQPGPDGPRVCERAYHWRDGQEIDVKIAIDRDMMEIFVGEEVAFTYRSYETAEHELGIYAQDGKALFYEMSFRA